MSVIPPRQDAPIAGSDGKATRSFYSWLQTLTRAVDSATAGTTVADQSSTDIAAIASVLGSPDGTVGAIPDQSTSSGQVLPVEGETTTAGLLSNGFVQVGLADVADTGAGAALVKITRDGKGRVEGTQAATTTDLTEGSNLYHTAARVLATVLTGLSASTATVITAADSVLVALGNLQAQISLKLNASLVSAFGLTLLDDADAAAARATLDAMPASLVVSGTNVDYTYVAADANVARGKTTGTPRNYTADASVLTVGAFYYAANYASTGDVTLLPFAGTTLRSAGVSVASFAVTPFKLTRFWVRSSAEVWII